MTMAARFPREHFRLGKSLMNVRLQLARAIEDDSVFHDGVWSEQCLYRLLKTCRSSWKVAGPSNFHHWKQTSITGSEVHNRWTFVRHNALDGITANRYDQDVWQKIFMRKP